MKTAKNVRELRGLMREVERVLDGSLQKIDRPARSGKFTGEPYITGGIPHRPFQILKYLMNEPTLAAFSRGKPGDK